MIALLAGKLGEGDNKKVIDAGVSVELIHLGSLYHDDVIDDATTRRGGKYKQTMELNSSNFGRRLPSCKVLWVGSWVIRTWICKAISFHICSACWRPNKEVQFSYDTNHGTEDYMKIIEGKQQA